MSKEDCIDELCLEKEDHSREYFYKEEEEEENE